MALAPNMAGLGTGKGLMPSYENTLKLPSAAADLSKASKTMVSDNASKLASEDSALMQAARTEGLKASNRRGLLNSSMAVGASQDAALRYATPLAQADTQAFMQAKTTLADIQAREGWEAANRQLALIMQENDIGLADRQQLRDIASREGMAEAERKLQDLMQQRQISSVESMASHDRALQKYGIDQQRELSELIQQRDIASREAMQRNDLQSRETLAAAERDLQKFLQQQEIGYQSSERGLDRELQERLASWNLNSADRNAAAQFLTQMESLYQSNYQSIMNNPNLSADQRTQFLTSASNLRDRQLDFVQQMYDVDLDWGMGQSSPAPAPSTVRTAPRRPGFSASLGGGQPFNPATTATGGIPYEYIRSAGTRG